MFNSYSSYGEDAILNGLFDRADWINSSQLGNKTYIDLGSFDPILHSNTFSFYLKGWRGTLVDANPIFIEKTLESRPEDLFLNNLVSTKSSTESFFIFHNMGSSNTASPEYADKISKSQDVSVSSEIFIKSLTLDEIVDIHIKRFNEEPFLIDIDIEGWDLEVIKSYSWKVRIPVVLIEEVGCKSFGQSEVKEEMLKIGYFPVATTVLSTVYIDSYSEYFTKIKNLGPNQ